MATALHFTLPPAELHAAFNALDLALAARAADGTGRRRSRSACDRELDLGPGRQARSGAVPRHARGQLRRRASRRRLRAATEASRATINDWVEDQTNDKIKDLLPEGSITTDTRLVLDQRDLLQRRVGRAVRGRRDHATAAFQSRPAHSSGADAAQARGARYGAGDGYRAAELPLRRRQLSMVVVVPDDLATFEADLDRREARGRSRASLTEHRST